MATSLSSLTGSDPFATPQARNAYDTWAIGLADNQAQRGAADLAYTQKLNALQDRLTQEQNVLPDKFAARGLLHSGIWNYGSVNAGNPYPGLPGSQLGALQQFANDSATAKGNLSSQWQNLGSQYDERQNALNTQGYDAMSGVVSTQAADQARQAITDAMNGA